MDKSRLRFGSGCHLGYPNTNPSLARSALATPCAHTSSPLHARAPSLKSMRATRAACSVRAESKAKSDRDRGTMSSSGQTRACSSSRAKGERL